MFPDFRQKHTAINLPYGAIKKMKSQPEKTAFARAYSVWFTRYDQERRRQKKRPGSRLLHFPDPPTSPAEIAAAVDTIGRQKVLTVLEIHRTTLDRWLTGARVIPRPAWLLIALLADGRLPGMSDDWREWRFEDDRLCLIGTRLSFSARELAGLQYQFAHADALARRAADLEKQTAYLLQAGRFDCANDPLIAAGFRP